MLCFGARGPFLERPGKLKGPVSYFEIEVSRKVGCVLTSNEVHFVSLAENFTANFQKFCNSHLERKTKQLNGPGNYRELRETGPRSGTSRLRLKPPSHLPPFPPLGVGEASCEGGKSLQ